MLVYLVTRDDLTSELFRHAIEAEAGLSTKVVESMHKLDEEGTTGSPGAVVLVDCRYTKAEDLILLLRREDEAFRSVYSIVLYNMERGSGLEPGAVRAGVRGFFYENDRAAIVIKGIRAIAAGDIWISREILLECAITRQSDGFGSDAEHEKLTSREIEVLLLVCTGKSNEEIGEELYISANTVRTHVQNILKKINVTSRFQAALWASKYL